MNRPYQLFRRIKDEWTPPGWLSPRTHPSVDPRLALARLFNDALKRMDKALRNDHDLTLAVRRLVELSRDTIAFHKSEMDAIDKMPDETGKDKEKREAALTKLNNKAFNTAPIVEARGAVYRRATHLVMNEIGSFVETLSSVDRDELSLFVHAWLLGCSPVDRSEYWKEADNKDKDSLTDQGRNFLRKWCFGLGLSTGQGHKPLAPMDEHRLGLIILDHWGKNLEKSRQV